MFHFHLNTLRLRHFIRTLIRKTLDRTHQFHSRQQIRQEACNVQPNWFDEISAMQTIFEHQTYSSQHGKMSEVIGNEMIEKYVLNVFSYFGLSEKMTNFSSRFEVKARRTDENERRKDQRVLRMFSSNVDKMRNDEKINHFFLLFSCFRSVRLFSEYISSRYYNWRRRNICFVSVSEQRFKLASRRSR